MCVCVCVNLCSIILFCYFLYLLDNVEKAEQAHAEVKKELEDTLATLSEM